MLIQDDTWWVIGCPERGTYMNWTSPHVAPVNFEGYYGGGPYTDTATIDEAERFESKDIANDLCATDPDIRRYLENRAGLGFRVCVVKRKTHVI